MANSSITREVVKVELDHMCNLSNTRLHDQYDPLRDEWWYRYDYTSPAGLTHTTHKIPAEWLKLSLNDFEEKCIKPMADATMQMLLS